MLTSIRIQNFRSIRDASVKLGQVNLFIGPNNSGKSNFLKGIEFLNYAIDNVFHRHKEARDIFASIITRSKEFIPPEIRSINYGINFEREDIDPIHFAVGQGGIVGLLDTNLSKVTQILASNEEMPGFYPKKNRSILALRHYLKDSYIFKPDPAKFQNSSTIVYEYKVAADGSNLVSFIFDLSQNHKSRFRRLEQDLSQCNEELVSISTPADPNESGRFKLKFFDKKEIGYWAEEVSEGVLYFLALLCIIHQPDPPKILLLEEPEKGIHPRRIKEVIDFIFELARLRDIQIILTSHSPYVVDHFADIPECISVFDRENGETVIHNAADLIAKTNEEYAAQGLPPTSYKDSLGEYWLSGFLGGVPL
ncbi:AAA family ATPase [Hymenobacter setariae]|uniref:AAA family ATPase n=1 Tax=Hymenobacter setariae TaxID=2594794 RepID=A0A558BUU2_9BACT|nr:AAA family ATPase [Hymenobacter setariae]TVT40296.1 AAA family ATPase [Hymenobacter setariae]